MALKAGRVRKAENRETVRSKAKKVDRKEGKKKITISKYIYIYCLLAYIILSASNDLIPQIISVCFQPSFKALLPVYLPQLDFLDKLPPNLKLSSIPWNSPTLCGILQHTSHLLTYLTCGVWEPTDSALTDGLLPSRNPYQESSSFRIPQGILAMANALTVAWPKVPLQWRSWCDLTVSSATCCHCSNHPLPTHSANPTGTAHVPSSVL